MASIKYPPGGGWNKEKRRLSTNGCHIRVLAVIMTSRRKAGWVRRQVTLLFYWTMDERDNSKGVVKEIESFQLVKQVRTNM